MPGCFLIDDLPGMLRTDEFACTVTVMTGSHGGDVFAAQLENPFSSAFGIEGNSPVLVAPSSTGLSDSDQVRIDDPDTGHPMTYRIGVPEPDKTGLTRYPLTEV